MGDEKLKSKQPTQCASCGDLHGARALNAVKTNNVQELEKLETEGFDFSIPDNRGETLLAHAAKHARVRALAFLATRSRLDTFDDLGLNAVSRAVRIACPDSLKILLDAGADPSATALCNAAPLLQAIEIGSLEMVDMLLAAGANPLAVNRLGQTSLMLAAASEERRSPEIFDKIICLSNIAELDVNGNSALMFAIGPAGAPRIPRLVMAGLSPSQPNKQGQTPLKKAHEMGYTLIQELLEACALAHAEQHEIEAISTRSLASKKTSRI